MKEVEHVYSDLFNTHLLNVYYTFTSARCCYNKNNKIVCLWGAKGLMGETSII